MKSNVEVNGDTAVAWVVHAVQNVNHETLMSGQCTTLHAWLRRPMSDSSSWQEQDLLSPHSSSKACSHWSLSVGRSSMNVEVLI